MFCPDFFPVSAYSYSSNSDYTLVFQPLKEVSFSLIQELFLGYNTLNGVQRAVWGYSDWQVSDFFLFKQILALIFSHYLNEEVAGCELLGVIVSAYNVLYAFRNEKH